MSDNKYAWVPNLNVPKSVLLYKEWVYHLKYLIMIIDDEKELRKDPDEKKFDDEKELRAWKELKLEMCKIGV